MPSPTPSQKIEQVKMFGEEYINVVLVGDTFDDAYHAAKQQSEDMNQTFVHPFNDQKVIEGQATVGLEIIDQAEAHPIHYVFVPVGGGGLAAGLSSVFKLLSPQTKIISVEPKGAAAMLTSIRANKNIELKSIDNFVDGGTAEIKERALLYANLKHYFIIKFPQRAGALRDFVVDILGPTDDITHFEYTKKANRENDVAVVGLELKSPDDLEPLITKY